MTLRFARGFGTRRETDRHEVWDGSKLMRLPSEDRLGPDFRLRSTAAVPAARQVMLPRALRLPAACLALALVLSASPLATPVAAFELFGVRLWGSSETVAPDALPYEAELNLSGGSDDLEDQLESASVLISEMSSPPSGSDGLIARALNDFDRLVAQLYLQGFYGGTVNIQLGGQPLQSVLERGEIPGPRPVQVSVNVTAGPLFTFGNLQVSTGAPGVPDSPQTWGLVPGETANSAKIVAAERQIVNALHQNGYPKARIANRDITADHATGRLDVELTAEAGPAATFGTVTVEGTNVTDAAFVAEMANIPEGERYDPEVLAKAQKRLNDLGIFASVSMVEGEVAGADGRMPITIQVAERKRHVLGAGATWSSSEGGGVEAYWRRRNLFGKGELLSVEGSVGRLGNQAAKDMEYAARIAFEKPGVFGPLTSFSTSLGAKQETPDAYTSRSVSGDAYLRRTFSDQLSGRVGAQVSFIDETDAFGNRTYLLAGIPAELTYDTRDDVFNPSRGLLAVAFAEPAYDIRNGNGMMFMKGSFSTYAALDDAKRFILAGRVAAGSIVAPGVDDVPASRRFFAGGGGSIRGYAYRNTGPRRNGQVTGGRSMVELSGEVRVRITESFGVVGFVDAGNTYSAIAPDLSRPFKIGVGGGIRYFTPIGPLRLDVAVPLSPEKDDPKFGIYLGLSQAF